MLFEACVDSVESGIMAELGGAKRLELCANLVDGGVTPSLGTYRVLSEQVQLPINILIRPRGGDFLYSDLEMKVMERDIEAFKAAGANGVVIGCLNQDGTVDEQSCRKLIQAARPMSVTFHRAFDVSKDPLEALQACKRMGVDHILTSGQRASAGDPEAKRLIRRLVDASEGKVSIIAGGGVSLGNIQEIVKDTGVRECHGTAGRVTVPSEMLYRPEPPLFMGGEKRNTVDTEFVTKRISSERLAAFVAAMESMQASED